MNAMGSVITIIMNIMLKGYPTGINVLSAYFKSSIVCIYAVFGLMQGTMPILSYNYGANEKKRFNSTFKLALFIALGVMAVGTLLFQCVPICSYQCLKSKPAPDATEQEIAKILADNEALVKDGAYAFRCISIAFVPAAFSILLINMLQSINCPISSLLMSLSDS